MNYSVKPKGQPLGEDDWGEEDDELLRAAKEQVAAALQIAKLAEERANRIQDAGQRLKALQEIETLRRQCQLVKDAAMRYLIPRTFLLVWEYFLKMNSLYRAAAHPDDAEAAHLLAEAQKGLAFQIEK